MDTRKWPTLESELLRVDPRSLIRREVNARYMDPVQFQRLVENVRMDGKLTSTVLVYRRDDGKLEILSGHHRTEAAIEADLKEIDVEVILTPLSEERKRAIQLSHNAISGKDDPALLALIWDGMDLDAKKYSGLTDDDISKFAELKIDGIGAAAPRYEEVVLMFLPEDKEAVDQALKRFTSTKARQSMYAARVVDFDRFFDAIVATKSKLKITNSSIAVLAMCELALERLEQLEADDEEGDDAGAGGSG